MRGVLIPGIALGLLTGAASPSSVDSAYEADEAAILASVASRARALAGGLPACIDLRLQRQLPGAPAAARQWARTARQGGAAGFAGIERALARRSGRSATTDRGLDGRALIDAAGLSDASLVARCPVAQRLAFSRSVQAGNAAIVTGSIALSCSSGALFVALRRRGRVWRVEGTYTQWIPGGVGDCGHGDPGRDGAAGHFLLVGG